MRFPKPPPAIMLFFLAPAIGELLSGSAPPLEFFNPFGFFMLTSLYGSGAVIIRELKVRWRKGIGAVLLLGAAYGILEEGLMVCSFFNPGWPDLEQLAVYGRWLDVNWVWALMLTIYHAVYSIAIPILLVELAYPERRLGSWVGSRMLKAVFTLLIGDLVLGFILFGSIFQYWPPIPQYLFTILVLILFVSIAYRFPANWGGNGKRPLSKVSVMWIIGTSGTFAFFIGFGLIPNLIPWWPVGILFGPVLVFIYAIVLKNYRWKQPNERHIFALASGTLTFFLVFAPLQELDATRTDNTWGMTIVGIVFLIGLILLRRRVWAYSSNM
jgi:hypothetical protein